MEARFHYDSRLAKLLLPEAYSAFTLGRHVFCRGPRLSLRSRIHEEAHVAQYERLGILGFLALYCWYQIRFGYRDNPLEREARARESCLDEPGSSV